MENTLIIRPVHNEYGEQIQDLILSIQQKEFGLSIGLNQQPDLRDIDANYHEGGGNFWGAFAGDELAGTIALINCGHHTGCVRKMFVKKEYRGKEWGTAQKLLDNLLQSCQDKGITAIYLGTVHELKAAQRFYERNGFNLLDVNDLPPYFPRMATDNLFYQLHLNK